MWRFTPLYTVSSGQPDVDTLVGFAAPQTTYGQNVVAVMYTRVGTSTVWQCKAWETTDRAEIVKDLKITLGIPDSDDELWDCRTAQRSRLRSRLTTRTLIRACLQTTRCPPR